MKQKLILSLEEESFLKEVLICEWTKEEMDSFSLYIEGNDLND